MTLRTDRLKQLRQLRGDSAIGISRKLNITYSDYEGGKNQPNAKKIKDLAMYFNVTSDYLLGLSDNMIPNTQQNDTYKQMLTRFDREALERLYQITAGSKSCFKYFNNLLKHKDFMDRLIDLNKFLENNKKE